MAIRLFQTRSRNRLQVSCRLGILGICVKTLASQASKALFAIKKSLIGFGDDKLNIRGLCIICMPNNKFPKLCYKLRRRWVENDTNCWTLKVSDLLFRMGFGEVWPN